MTVASHHLFLLTVKRNNGFIEHKIATLRSIENKILQGNIQSIVVRTILKLDKFNSKDVEKLTMNPQLQGS